MLFGGSLTFIGQSGRTLNHEGLTYNGTYNEEQVEMKISIKDLPTYGMCTDLTRFYTFYKGKFIEFYPENETVEKWFLCTESLHRYHNGKWRNFKFEKK